MNDRGAVSKPRRRTVVWGTHSPRGRRRRSFVARVAATVPLLFFASAAASATRSEGATAPSVAATVSAHGAQYLGAPSSNGSPVVSIAASPGGRGYYVLSANGVVSAYGAPYFGSLGAKELPDGVTATGLAVDEATGGYWVLTSDGHVEGFRAPYRGEPHIALGGWGQYPAAVALAPTPDGRGYYVLRANGAIDAFGATARPSHAGRLPYGTTAPVVAVSIAVDPITGGYWVATSVGGVWAVDAPYDGSPLSTAHGHYNGVATVAIAPLANGGGYDLARANGQVTSYGSAPASVAATPLPFGAVVSSLAVDDTTNGYYVALDDATASGYVNPLRAVTSLVPQEIDQGVDYCGFGPLYPLGPAVVVNVYNAGWPSGVFIAYRLLSGLARGRVVYDAENITPLVTRGERVTATTVLGILHDAKTCLETGWANGRLPNGHAAGQFEYDGRNSTAYGLNFSALLSDLGVRPGLPQPGGVPGPLKGNWPTWG